MTRKKRWLKRDLLRELKKDMLKQAEKISNNTKMEEDISKIEKIVESLGEISIYGLSNEQKIQFTYSISKLNYQARTIFNYINANKLSEQFPLFMQFCTSILKYSYLSEEIKNSKSKYKQPIPKDSWLKPFKIETKFYYGANNELVRCYYNNKSGVAVEITLKVAQEILDILTKNSIPTAYCIVQEAFKKYALGELDKFIEDINSGNYLEANQKIGYSYTLTPNGIVGTLK